MPPDTPPTDPFDHKPAHAWAAGMEKRADGQLGGLPYWHRWALIEAYMAGRADGREAAAKVADAFAEQWGCEPEAVAGAIRGRGGL